MAAAADPRHRACHSHFVQQETFQIKLHINREAVNIRPFTSGEEHRCHGAPLPPPLQLRQQVGQYLQRQLVTAVHHMQAIL